VTEVLALPLAGTEAASAAELARLAESFRTFNRATRDLEAAYAALKARADRIDARLAETNGELSAKVAELDRAGGRLHATLDALPCGVVIAGKDGSVERLNRAAERILGRAAVEIVGRDAAAVRGKDGAPLLLLAEPTASSAAERSLAACDGARRRVASHVVALPDGGRLEILVDLTEVAHLRTQLNRLDTLAALGEMAAGIAHEVRNPLNAVDGFAGLLMRALEGDAAPDKSQLLRYADRIRRGVAEVEEIIASLLQWARPERLSRSAFGARALCEEAVAALAKPRAEGAAARIEVAGEDDGAPIVADRVKLKLVLVNLVKNAVEAAGASGRVVVRYRRDRAGFEASVEDDGPGVAPEMRKKLFRPFSTDKASGTGLGLAVAKKLAECHGGELKLVEGVLGGAKFVLVVPEQAAAAAAGVAS
jgi:signal transduction histidine kinase